MDIKEKKIKGKSTGRRLLYGSLIAPRWVSYHHRVQIIIQLCSDIILWQTVAVDSLFSHLCLFVCDVGLNNMNHAVLYRRPPSHDQIVLPLHQPVLQIERSLLKKRRI